MELTKKLLELTKIQSDGVAEQEDTMEFQGKTISLRADGRYWSRYYSNGKQLSVYGKTKIECYNKLKLAIKNKDKPREEKSKSKFTLYSWLDFWNETYKKPFNRTDSITGQIKRHIKTNIEDKPLSAITGLDLQQALNRIENNRTKVEIYNIYRGSFRTAAQQQLIRFNPAEALVKAPHQKQKGLALTIEEEKQFLSIIKNNTLENLFKFYLTTGVRRSEALSVNLQDVDFNKKTIRIHGTKTLTSDRTIPLFKATEDLLKATTPDKNGFYFTGDKDNITHEFKMLCPAHKLHDLRHTFATRCLEQGIAMKTVQIWLGHADYQTTANIYTDLQAEFNVKESKKINMYFDTCFDTCFDTHSDT